MRIALLSCSKLGQRGRKERDFVKAILVSVLTGQWLSNFSMYQNQNPGELNKTDYWVPLPEFVIMSGMWPENLPI